MSKAEKNTPMENAAPEEQDLTYGDIVWGQLQKNKYGIDIF